jgi:CheY-like chemotaxis protein
MTEKTSYSFVIVEDDMIMASLMIKLLEAEGHTARHISSGHTAINELPTIKPDCVILDLMMPEVDGFTTLQELKREKSLDNTSFIVVSAKAYDFDRKQALRLGADGFMTKPINPSRFVERLERVLGDHMSVSFWGCRGTLPVPGEQSLKYGGNTSCVSIEFPNDQLFIFDAGSGIKKLSDFLLAQQRPKIEGKIFISHPHWDHINALPFFAPLYIQGNEFEILGAKHGDLTMREIVSAQMDGVYFPITLNEFAARIYFHDLYEENLKVGSVDVSTMLLSHPGVCLGYKVNYKGRTFCYITDNELYYEDNIHFNPHYEKRLTDFIHGCDALVIDTSFTDEEYQNKIGWGHSCVSRVVDIAHKGEVKNLYLFHHEPNQTDGDIDAKFLTAQDLLKELGSDTVCHCPKEGDTLMI